MQIFFCNLFNSIIALFIAFIYFLTLFIFLAFNSHLFLPIYSCSHMMLLTIYTHFLRFKILKCPYFIWFRKAATYLRLGFNSWLLFILTKKKRQKTSSIIDLKIFDWATYINFDNHVNIYFGHHDNKFFLVIIHQLFFIRLL